MKTEWKRSNTFLEEVGDLDPGINEVRYIVKLIVNYFVLSTRPVPRDIGHRCHFQARHLGWDLQARFGQPSRIAI